MPSSPNLLWPWAEGHGVCADPVPLGIAQVPLVSFSLCRANLELISRALPFRLHGSKARKHMKDAVTDLGFSISLHCSFHIRTALMSPAHVQTKI